MFTTIMKLVSIVALLLAVLRLPTGSYQLVFEVVVCMSGLLAATQAVRARTCGACPPDVPLAGLGLPRGVSDLVGCTEGAADTLDTIDNRSDAGKRVAVKLQAWRPRCCRVFGPNRF
jgi:hypothetical protein